MISKFELSINVLVHILILFSILSLLFWFVISKLETKTITNEVEDSIDTVFDSYYRKLDSAQKIQLKNLVDSNKETLQTMEAVYSEPDKVNATKNQWLLYVNILYICLLFLVLVSIVIVLRLSCSSPPILGILKENIILFVFIGIIEVLFFLNVAVKYIPVKPSFMSQVSLETVKNSL
jgi:hypothetical protein